MRKTALSVAFLLLLPMAPSTFAQSVLAGKYTCKVSGSNYISDGQGSSVRYLNGDLVVDASNGIKANAMAQFTVKGQTPKVKNKPISGTGILSNLSEDGGDASAYATFPVYTDVFYRGSKLTGTAKIKLEARSGFGLTLKIATMQVNTKLGIIYLGCKS